MHYTGSDGSLSYQRLLSNGTRDSRRVAKVRKWNLDTTLTLVDAKTLGDFADRFEATGKGATGSCDLLYYRFDPGDGQSETHYQFTALLNKLVRRGRITREESLIRLALNVGKGGQDRIVFDSWVTAARLGSAVGELSSASIQFTVEDDFTSAIETALGTPYAE
jgi:hypothetical protein